MFDTTINRWGTHSAKWDLLAAHLGDDALSLSVADMEFATCPEVSRAIEDACAEGIFGYTEVFDDFREAAARWQERRHGWALNPRDVHFFPRIVQCVSALCSIVLPRSLGRPPRVVTLDPAYGPINEVVERAGCELRRVPLDLSGETPQIPEESFARAMEGADLLLWCSPHNPTGRVWSEGEMEMVASLALEREVLVLSDDIHADFQRPGRNRYQPLAAIARRLWESGHLIQCMSPGKTFNTAGLEASAIAVRGKLGERLEEAKRLMGLHNPNFFAIPATIAAWNLGEAWVDELRARIDANLRVAVDYLRQVLPQARVVDPDGTYLVWVDARAYLASASSLNEAVAASRVAVSPGEDFGASYEGFFRINVALPERDLMRAIERLCKAMTALAPDSADAHSRVVATTRKD